MPKLPRISGKEAITAFQNIGFQIVRQKGSHVVMKKQTENGEVGCSIPLHSDLAIGTLTGILRLAKVTHIEFINALEK